MDETTIAEAAAAVESGEVITLNSNKKEVKKDFVSKKEFDTLKEDMNKSFSQIVELIKQKPEEKAKQVVQDKKVDEASSNVSENNPRYDAKARQILGDKVERTFIEYPKGGGIMFTVSIKEEASNAGDDHWKFYKHDYRSVNLEREEFRGEEGVDKWCKLILANLTRPAK